MLPVGTSMAARMKERPANCSKSSNAIPRPMTVSTPVETAVKSTV
jgi:hypothetical protein